MGKINEIIEVIWKSGHSDNEMAKKLIVDLPKETARKLIAVSHFLRTANYNELLATPDKDWDTLATADSCNTIDIVEVIQELLVCFYLSEHRLDEYVQGSKELRQMALNKLTKEWGVDEEFLLKTYLSWASIKRYLKEP